MTKEYLSNLTSRTYAIAERILVQLNDTRPTFREKFFYGVLARQVLLLENITKTLLSNSEATLTTVFILSRCLLDDFITVLYFQSKHFNDAELISHTARAFDERFKTIASSRKINYKYFEGKNNQLVDSDHENKNREEFLSNVENARYFKNKKKFEFKNFPSTTTMVDLLPKTDLGKANAHAFVLWRHLSHYVHYSMLTYGLETTGDTRDIEINQLKEVLSYCYKTIVMSSDILKKWGKQLELTDPSDVWKDINA